MIFDEIISKLVFDEDELELLEIGIRKKLETEGKLEDDIRTTLKQAISRAETKQERTLATYVDADNDHIRELLGASLQKMKTEIDEMKNRLENLPNVSEWNAEKIREPLEYARTLSTRFKEFPPKKKRNVARAIFEHIVVHNKKIVGFRLKPLFQGIFQREVLTRSKKKKG